MIVEPETRYGVTVTIPIKQLDEQGLSIKSQAFADWLRGNGLQVLDISFRYVTLAAGAQEGP